MFHFNFMKKICKLCGNIFLANKSKRLFCSRSCGVRGRSGNKRYNKFLVNCDLCGGDIFVKPYLKKINKLHFCNNGCHAKWRSKNSKGSKNPNYKNSGNRICEGCGNAYKSYNKDRKFCGVNCGQRYEKDHPMYKAVIGNKYEMECAKILYNNGWLVGKSEASRGPFDIVGIKGRVVKFIQVKKTGTRNKLSPSLWKDIIKLKVPLFVVKEVWVNNKNEDWEIIKI